MQQVKAVTLKRNLVSFVFTALAWTLSPSATTEAFSNTAYGNPPNHLSPQDGQTICLNPSAFVWPRQDSAFTYQMQLSRNPGFAESRSVTSKERPWCFYNHHEPLEPGTWYWRYRTNTREAKGEWSQATTFTLTPHAVAMPAKSFDDFLATIPRSRPRQELAGRNIAEFREQAKKHPYFSKHVERCTDALAADEPSLKELQQGFLLTGDPAFARKGAALLTERIENYTPGHNFLNVRQMGVIAGLFDSFSEFLDEPTRHAFLDKARETLEQLNYSMGRVEQKAYDNHFWQMSAFGYLRTAMALAHEWPETHVYLEYIYGLLMAKHPVLGPADGGWANGHGYFHVNDVTILGCTKDLQLGGVDLFAAHPWYRNTVKYLMYCTPVGSQVPGFGDKSETHPNQLNSMVLQLLFRQAKDDPMAQWQLRRQRRVKAWKTDFSYWDYIVAGTVEEDWLDAPEPKAFANAAVFNGVGLAALHSDLNGDPDDDIVVYFRSSPYGGGIAHMTCSQNAFNISYKGEKLFYHTGNYQAGFASDHVFTDYRHTRSHNGVLVNGLSQGFGTQYYGWIKHFGNVDQIAYACGDASMAYGGVDDKAGEHQTGKYGLGYLAPLLTKYDRHLVFCRPNLLVVYDDLEAKEAATFNLVLNSRSTDCELTKDGQFHVRSGKGEGVAQVFASQNESRGYSNEYVTPFRDERPSRAGFLTNRRSTKARFLTIVQMGDKAAFEAQKLSIKDGRVDVGGFMVEAELDDNNPPMLRVAGNGAKLIVENGDVPTLSGTENGESRTEVAPYLPPSHLNLLPAPNREDETLSRP